MTVRLHIERLVVEGIESTGAEAAMVRAALEEELVALLSAAPQTSWNNLAVPALPLEPIGVQPDQDARRLGREAGAALYRGLRP